MSTFIRHVFATCTLLAMLVPSVSAQDVLRLRGSQVLGEKIVPILVTHWMSSIGYGELRTSAMNGNGLRISGVRDAETLDVEIAMNGSALGFQDLIDGDTEVAMMARPLTAKELDAGWQLGQLDSPDQEFVIALQALAAIVHPQNSMRAISAAQLADIVAGRIRDWQQLGGKPGPIHLHLASSNTGLGQMQMQLLKTKVSAVGVTYSKTVPAIAAAVRADPLAIGVTVYGSDLRGVRALAMRVAGRNMPANKLSVTTEDYPLVRRLFFRTGQLVTALGRGFVNYAVSDVGQKALAQRGYLALTPTRYESHDALALPESYANLISGLDRLSLNFRFGSSFSILDSRGMQDIGRIQAFMARPENSHRKIVLIGLSGKQPTPYQALSLSSERADLVAQILGEVGIFPVRVRGAGNVLPLVEANSRSSQDLRVEVWLR